MSGRKSLARLEKARRRRNDLIARSANTNLVPACIESLEVRTVLTPVLPGLDDHGLVIGNAQVAGQSSLLIDSAYNSQLSFNFNGSGLAINLDNSAGQISSLKSVVLRDIIVENNANAGIQINLSNITLDRLAINRALVTNNGGAGVVFNLNNATIGELVIWDSDYASLFPNTDATQSRYINNASDGIYFQGQNSTFGNLYFQGNLVESNGRHGVNLNLNAVQVSNFSLNDSLLRNNEAGSGINFETNRTNLNGSVFKNTITGNSSHGMSFLAQSLLTGSTPTNSSSNFRFNTFSDNELRNNGGSGLTAELREKTTWAGTLLRNNFSNNGLRGIDFQAIDTENAFDLVIGAATVNAQGTLIDGNQLTGNTGAAISLALNDSSGNTSNTTGRFRIVGNVISGTLEDATSNIYNGEGINIRATGDVTRQNGAARFFSSLIDRNTIGTNVGDGIRFNIAEDSELTDLVIGNTSGPQLTFDVNGTSPGGGNIVPVQGDGNVIQNNGGNGITIVRRDSSIIENVRIIDNRVTGNTEGILLQASNTYQTVPNAARPNLRVVSGFVVRRNDISGNDLNGVHLRTEFNAVLLADLYYNRIDSNGLNGIRVTGLENNLTDFENVGGLWIKNAITNNGTNTVRAALGLAALPLDDENGNGIRIENVVGSVNPLVIGRDGADTDSQSFGNYIAFNGSDGIEVGARAGGASGGSTTVPVDVRDGLDIINNQIISNGRNGVGDPYNAGKGIDIEVLLGQPREFRIDRNIIQGNVGDGIELLNSGGKLRLTAKGNFIDLNGGRGVDLLNRGNAQSRWDAEATVVFGDANGPGVVNRNIVTRNGLEGIYIVNTVTGTQTQNVSSEAALLTYTMDGDGAGLTYANLVIDIENNEIRDNGLGIGNPGLPGYSPPSFLSGTGLVLRVGSQGSATSFSTVPDISGYASVFSDESLGGVGTNGFDGGNSVSGGFSITANGRVNARVVDNEFSGNGGDDVLLESFVSLMPRDTPGTWNATEFRDINSNYDRDPLARLNLVFTGNTGDSVDVVRGTGANDQQTYSFTNAEGTFKSRTNKTAPDPSGPFGGNASRDRVITRVADRPVSNAGINGNLASSYPDTYSGFFSSGAPDSGPNRAQAGFGSATGTLGLIDGTNVNGAVRITVASRTGVVEDATNANPSVLTSANHGLFTGDQITISGATGNTNINGLWNVQRLSANTFQLRDPNTNALVAGNAAYNANSASWVLAGQHRLNTGDIVSITNVFDFGQIGEERANGTFVVNYINDSTFEIYIPNVISQETAVLGWGGTATGGLYFEHNSNKFHYDGIGPSTFRIESNQSVSGFSANQLGDNFLTTTSVGTSPVSIGWDRVAVGTFSYLTASISDVTVNEADGTATLTITLSADAPDEFVGSSLPNGVRIYYRATDGSAKLDPNNDGNPSDGDYGLPVNAVTGDYSVIVLAGTRTATITVDIKNDSTFDQIEQFYVDLYQISTGDFVDSRAVVTITPDGDSLPTVTVGNITVDEATGVANFVVNLSSPSSEVVTVDFATVASGTAKAGSDFAARTGSISFTPGQTSVNVPIVINADALDETDETFQLRISNASNATITGGQAFATATINDTRYFSVSDVTVSEGGTATVTVTLNEPLAAGATAFVSVTTENGNALAGSDYTTKTDTLTFTGSTTSLTFTVDTTADVVKEGDEYFLVRLTGATGAAIAKATGRITIADPWEAESELPTGGAGTIGRVDGDGWSANTAADAPGFLIYGPYTTVVPAGPQKATYRLLVDNNTFDNAKVVRVDVWDSVSGVVLAQRDLNRRDFKAANQYQDFDLSFINNTAGNALEFRVWWYDTSYAKVDNVRVSTAPVAPLVLQAESNLFHLVGRADGDGWSANTAQDSASFLAYGPYTKEIPAGPQSATFRLLVDNNTFDNSKIVTIDVFDASVGRVIAQRVLVRSEFSRVNEYQDFVLEFNNSFGSNLEFRVFWHDTSYVKLDRVIVSKTPTPVLRKFEAETSSLHLTGRKSGDGWSANTVQDGANYLYYGPYTTDIPAGTHVALFSLQVDNNTFDNSPIVTVEVVDHSTPGQQRILARRTINRTEFKSVYDYQDFSLQFTNSAGANLEFRVFWHDTSFVQLDHIVVLDTPAPQRLIETEGSQVAHFVGRAAGRGWSANTAQDSAGYLATGPYGVSSLPSGSYTANFRLLVDNNTFDNSPIVTIDVFNRATGQVLAQRTITRLEFTGALAYQDFALSFNTPAGADLEFRTFWHATSYVEQDYVRILPQNYSVSAELEPVFQDIDQLLLIS